MKRLPPYSLSVPSSSGKFTRRTVLALLSTRATFSPLLIGEVHAMVVASASGPVLLAFSPLLIGEVHAKVQSLPRARPSSTFSPLLIGEVHARELWCCFW